MHVIRFYRTGEPFGWLSNFAPSPFTMPPKLVCLKSTTVVR
ncbi:MAG: hypothetical protein WD069_00455 [Planctomycetales bacterium]